MSATDFGPVPISRLKAETNEIFDALADGRRVLISSHGRVVAIVDPALRNYAAEVMAYALPGPPPLNELRASDLSRKSPSRFIAAAGEGEPAYVTRSDKVFGILRSPVDDELAARPLGPQEVREREREVQTFLAEHPDATAAELVAFSDESAERLRAERLPSEAESEAEAEFAAQVRRAAQMLEDVPGSLVGERASTIQVHTLVAQRALEQVESVLAERGAGLALADTLAPAH